ncbi:MAG: endonuclease/exonuclease/phosphatase family protein [Erythrobacter sp.]|uniref:endonuclease/exonuclease/phosphatase family protein n=1 Tax=Erythrobacter sp. TaxID=1042 RepID=UPI00260878E2|nr:endonuclease/exonuclease/phosphatase family protein [Erythrobacter sp.]MDJ0977598.1 endonuclease/exonuclease/phosphatase family protein [Erythrobacter sp.]
MSRTEVKVASYNIRKAIGTDRTRRPIRILNVLEEIDADIVILQEADRRFGRRQSALPPFLIEAHSNYRAVPLDVQRDSMGWHGNAILVREHIAIEHHDIIHIPYLEPRGVITARLRVRGRPVSVFGMHLDLSGLWRTRQANVIADLALEEQEFGPTILTGDLNEWRPNAGCLKVFGKHFSVLDCGRSFHSLRPLARLDRIMHCDRVEALECGVHRSSLATRASDHLPVWARLRL